MNLSTALHRREEEAVARSSAGKQIPVYLAKNYRLFMNQRDWKFILIAAVIGFLVCAVVGNDMFRTYEDTESGFFAIISAGIWIGIFNSIQTVCKEHETIASEYRAGLHISAYILAHIIFEFAVCFIQAALLTGICFLWVDFPAHHVLLGAALPEYFITLFLIVWASDIMGLMVSSVSSTPNVAMTAMPFLLILQLVMSGVLFRLSGWAKYIAYITCSKWGMSALGCIGNLNDPDLPLGMSLAYPEIVRLSFNSAYDPTVQTLLTAWGSLLLICFGCTVIAILSLKIRNRGA